jgi:tetratricopeptide (TPR) repeat protein
MSQVYEIQYEVDGEGLIAYQNVASENPAFQARLGDYYHFSAGENKKALLHYRKGHKLLPDELYFVEKITEVAYYLSDYSTASSFYKKLQKHRPLTNSEMRQAAWASQSAKKYYMAIAYWEMLTQNFPTDTNILVNLGFCYGKIDNSEKALECSKKAYNINPHDYVAMLNIGFRYWVLGDLPNARFFTEKALKGYANYSYALMNLGHINWCEGDEEKADDYYYRSMKATNNKREFERLMRDDSKYIGLYHISLDTFEDKLQKILAMSIA